MKVSCIGIGVMGGALMKAVIKSLGSENLIVSDNDVAKAENFAKETGCKVAKSNLNAAKDSDIVFIAVKPPFVASVFDEIASELAGKIVVSVVAGLTIKSLKELFSFGAMMSGSSEEGVTFIRLMPNIPAVVGEAMIALSSDAEQPQELSTKASKQVAELLTYAGKVEFVQEKMMDAVTAISGSGPAYAYLFIEALADAAVGMGMTRNQAYLYASQTLKGAASMQLETGKHPAELKDAVCSPAGTTIEGVKVLERLGFRSAIINAAEAAFEKSQELGRSK